MKKKKAPKKQVVPFELKSFEGEGFHLFLQVKIENKRLRMLIDTGASKTVLDKKFLATKMPKLKPQLNENPATGLGSNSVESHLITVKSLKIGEKELKNFHCAVLDLTHVNQTYKLIKIKPIQGVLGSDVLKQFKALLDFGNKKLTLF